MRLQLVTGKAGAAWDAIGTRTAFIHHIILSAGCTVSWSDRPNLFRFGQAPADLDPAVGHQARIQPILLDCVGAREFEIPGDLLFHGGRGETTHGEPRWVRTRYCHCLVTSALRTKIHLPGCSSDATTPFRRRQTIIYRVMGPLGVRCRFHPMVGKRSTLGERIIPTINCLSTS